MMSSILPLVEEEFLVFFLEERTPACKALLLLLEARMEGGMVDVLLVSSILRILSMLLLFILKSRRISCWLSRSSLDKDEFLGPAFWWKSKFAAWFPPADVCPKRFDRVILVPVDDCRPKSCAMARLLRELLLVLVPGTQPPPACCCWFDEELKLQLLILVGLLVAVLVLGGPCSACELL